VRIVYTCLSAPFADTPRTLYETLVARDLDATHAWLCTDGTQGVLPPGVEGARLGTTESVELLESADIVISNVCIGHPWTKRRDAIYLQTWHGGPVKLIHNDVPRARPRWLTEANLDVARWSMLISPSPAISAVLRRAFDYSGPVHETGYPRNDVLSSTERDGIRSRVRAELGISDGTTAILYMPTWRDRLAQHRAGGGDFEVPLNLDDFTRRLGGGHVLLLRLHGDVSGRPSLAPGTPVQDVSDFIDTTGLYLAADAMITDYSSAMFDFAITRKPMLFFTYDLEDYRRRRGLYFDLPEIAPGPLLSTSDQVIDAITDIDRISVEYAERYDRFRMTFCPHDDGHATDRVLDLLFRSLPA
jgi:CDP-glycerol glycerophosphotransferase